MIKNQAEAALLPVLEKVEMSPSHDHWHWERVRDFALQLQKTYDGDARLLEVAALLHDLGRTNPTLQGGDSRRKSIEMAREILLAASAKMQLSSQDIERLMVAIDEHDQPEKIPSTIEGRILKEADFLAGLGAWGILRIAMWAAETGEGMPGILRRLNESMPQRVANLSFPQSMRTARFQMRFARLFLSELDGPASLSGSEYRGAYVLIEGMSGSGKDTLAAGIQERLGERDSAVTVVKEPTPLYKAMRRACLGLSDDPVVQLLLLMCDRYALIEREVRPAMDVGRLVLSVRSYISALAYQESRFYSPAQIEYFHTFVPAPDLILLLDLDPELAFSRISRRATEDGETISEREELDHLRQFQKAYLTIAETRRGEGFIRLDGSRSPDRVLDDALRHIEPILEERAAT